MYTTNQAARVRLENDVTLRVLEATAGVRGGDGR